MWSAHNWNCKRCHKNHSMWKRNEEHNLSKQQGTNRGKYQSNIKRCHVLNIGKLLTEMNAKRISASNCHIYFKNIDNEPKHAIHSTGLSRAHILISKAFIVSVSRQTMRAVMVRRTIVMTVVMAEWTSSVTVIRTIAMTVVMAGWTSTVIAGCWWRSRDISRPVSLN